VLEHVMGGNRKQAAQDSWNTIEPSETVHLWKFFFVSVISPSRHALHVSMDAFTFM
jgi:hypothetical protein